MGLKYGKGLHFCLNDTASPLEVDPKQGATHDISHGTSLCILPLVCMASDITWYQRNALCFPTGGAVSAVAVRCLATVKCEDSFATRPLYIFSVGLQTVRLDDVSARTTRPVVNVFMCFIR